MSFLAVFILLSLPIHFLFSCTVFLRRPMLLYVLLALHSVFYHLFFFQDFGHELFCIYAVHVLVKNQFAFCSSRYLVMFVYFLDLIPFPLTLALSARFIEPICYKSINLESLKSKYHSAFNYIYYTYIDRRYA
jgi:hypothetical protein